MKLVLEIINTPKHDIFQKNVQFDTRGGKIGRSKSAKWTLNDPSRTISNFHADISYRDSRYYITDISTNGVFIKTPYKKLVKDTPVPLNEKMVIMIGDYDIAVKALDSAFSQKPEGLLLQKEDTGKATIPDEFFIGNPDEKAFGIIQGDTAEENDIVSLLKEENAIESDPVFSDIDKIMGFDEIEDEIEAENPLAAHIDPPTFREDEVPDEVTEKVASSNQSSILKILGLKMGVDIENMSSAEQETFAMNVAEIAFVSIEHLRDTKKALDKIQRQLGLPPSTHPSNPIGSISRVGELSASLSTRTQTLIPAVKNIFRDINTHNIACYTTLKNISQEAAARFSPDKLYYEFEKSQELNKSFTNKKALAWEAYCKKFKILDTMEAEEETDLFGIQKEYKSILDTINMGYGS